ncbi:hypothetical protein B0H16DRAFT_1424231 [Mycena metata]|uniref:Uncharacterized protein n=1 Tax=Mycena metata TaxID=1033252 RepID=A0AAD7MZV4_9AGAR|nr:hypothetical protein B0H16DRAFT_1424231 [Mycena metata]
MKRKQAKTDGEPVAQDAPAPKTRTRRSNLPDFPWTDNKSALISSLITEMEKPENSKVLFGKKEKGENTSGDKKVTVYKRIGQAIVPEFYELEPATVGDRCRAKIDWLQKQYKHYAQRLHQTGGGVGVETLQEEDGKQYMAFYIPSSGPDCTTVPPAVNIWQQIKKEFKFFPRLHTIFATRPNVTPVAITTGLGPNGPNTVFYQPPDDLNLPKEAMASITSLHDILTRFPGPVNAKDQDDAAGALWSDHDDPSAQPDDDDPSTQQDHAGRDSSPEIEEIPATPAPRKAAPGASAVKKENVAPTLSGKARGPKALQQEASVEKAKASIKKLPVKRSPLDMLLSLQESNLKAINARAEAESERATSELRLKQKQHLLEELRLGVWTPGEYRKKVKKLDKQEAAPAPQRGYSPDWDLDSDLPSSSP